MPLTRGQVLRAALRRYTLRFCSRLTTLRASEYLRCGKGIEVNKGELDNRVNNCARGDDYYVQRCGAPKRGSGNYAWGARGNTEFKRGDDRKNAVDATA